MVDDPLTSIAGVGKKTAEKIHANNVWTFDTFKISIRGIKCIHGCPGTGTEEEQDVKMHSYCWSPMICIDRKVWVYYQRLKCKSCNKSFTTIHPKFMSQLPTQ